MLNLYVVAACLACGCTDNRACEDGCGWVWVDRDAGEGLCTSCVPAEVVADPVFAPTAIQRLVYDLRGVHARRCKAFIGISGRETYCDWIPSRFVLRKVDE